MTGEEIINKYKNILHTKGEAYLQLKVHPHASKTAIKDLLVDETIRINIAAPPDKGKANKELISYLAGIFDIDKNNIKIISGASDRHKLLKIIN